MSVYLTEAWCLNCCYLYLNRIEAAKGKSLVSKTLGGSPAYLSGP